MNTLGKAAKEADDATPNRYTLAWWKEQLAEIQKGYRGATHGLNRCLADNASLVEADSKVQARCDVLEKRQTETDAEIGRMRADLVAMELTIEKARAAYSELKGTRDAKST